MATFTIIIATSSSAGGTTQNLDFTDTTPPAVPVNGMRWWNSETGRMYLYYTDANSSQWVEV